MKFFKVSDGEFVNLDQVHTAIDRGDSIKLIFSVGSKKVRGEEILKSLRAIIQNSK
jgi:hypothetical protein